MASIEYGIDGYGKKVYAPEAYSGRTYICPYCSEEIHVRKCHDREDYFAHMPNSKRTPQQMICPGYKGEGVYKRIEGVVDKVFITNGGLPLYLCAFANGKYQLNAYFPPLGQSCINLLEDWKSKVVISENGVKEEYLASDIRFYRVKTTADWIKVKCTDVKYLIPEVQQKWEWGIRGLDYENDIFHSHYDGGCRVALHSNIVVGKEYLIAKRNDNVSPLKGVSFAKKGILRFNNLYGREYIIYAMKVNSVTEEAIAFIQNKGYQLIEQSDEIIPMWPPAVIEGKELIYHRYSGKAFLFHNKRSDQKIFNIVDGSLVSIRENDNLFETDTNNNTLLLSDHQFNSLSNEIRFMLTQTRSNFVNAQAFKSNVMWKNDENLLKPLTIEETELFKAKKLYFEADSNINICVLKKNYVEVSSKRILESLKRHRILVIDVEPFGKIWVEPKTVIKKENETRKMKINQIVEALNRCNTVSVPFSNEFLEVLEYARVNSYELFRIMSEWKQKQKIPYAAVKYLYSIKGALRDE